MKDLKDAVLSSRRRSANDFGVDGKAGRHEFIGRTDGILLGIYGLYPSVKRVETLSAGDSPGVTYETSGTIEAHSCKMIPMRG